MRNHYVLVFGLGMIGSAIRNSLLLHGYKPHRKISINWCNADDLKSDLACVSSALSVLPEADHLSFVWSAGKARFNATSERIKQEQNVFTDTINALFFQPNIINTPHFRFHLISSAGGLYEGQNVITAQSKENPRRPYGYYKLSQEEALLATLGSDNVFIYRPSSVYGPAKNTKAPGLINTLITNNLNNHSITNLDANIMALRDYVFSEDIGRYVARQITTDYSNQKRPRYLFLISGRSASIFEVLRKLESIMHTKLLILFDQNYGNSSNMTFSPTLMPADWLPTDLQTGMKLALSTCNISPAG